MQSFQNRPQTSSATYQSGQLAQSGSPQKGFKTRTIYKNAPVEEDPNDRRSLYEVSYNKNQRSLQAQQAAQDKNKLSGQKLTLADIGSLKRSSTDKNNLSKAGKSIGFEVDKSRGSTRSSQLSQNSERNHRVVNSNKQVEKKTNKKVVDEPLEVTRKGKVVEMSRHVVKDNNDMIETVTQTIRHPQERAKSVATGGAYHGCGCPIHDATEVLATDGFKATWKSDFGANPDANIKNNAGYFDTVRKLDVCGQCWAEQKKFAPTDPKLHYKGPGMSLYKKDFVKHPLGDQGPVLKNDFYTTFQSSFPLDATSTMRNDYRPYKTGPIKKETMDFRPATSGIPFGGNTNYRIDYPNWGPNLIVPEKAPHQKTTISELPFNARTTYGDEFSMPEGTSAARPVDKDLWGSKKAAPFTSGIPFLGSTTHGDAFKPFKVAKVPGFEPVQEYEPTQALPEHLKSLYKKDYGVPKSWVCPAAVFMQHHPHPKYRYGNEKAL